MSVFKKRIAESSSYNLLTVYLTFLFGIVNTFIIARLLIPEEWALIILTLTFTSFAILFCNLFPPNAQDSIMYYIPHLASEDSQKDYIKRNFIFHVYKIRLICALIILCLYLVITNFANFQTRLYDVILIMAPMIIFNVIIALNNAILIAFHKFKLVFIIKISNSLIVMVCNLLIFILRLEKSLYLISYAYLFGALISCIISIFLIIHLIPSRKKEGLSRKKDGLLSSNSKSDFYQLHKGYGLNLIIADIFALLTSLIIYLLFLNYGDAKYITYLAICQISVASACLFSSSIPSSYISIFSEINYEKNPQKYEDLFRKLSIFLMLFNCIIIAIMLFYIIIYIVVIYSEVYLVILLTIQIFLFSAFAKMIINNFLILTKSINKTKANVMFGFIEMMLMISFTIIAILFFDFFTLIILYVIGSFFMTFMMFLLVRYHSNFKLKLIFFFKPFIAFLISFLITTLIFSQIIITIFDKAYMHFLLVGTLKFLTFLVFFYILIYYLKVLTKKDFMQLVEIIPILNSKNVLIQKIVGLIERLLPS